MRRKRDVGDAENEENIEAKEATEANRAKEAHETKKRRVKVAFFRPEDALERTKEIVERYGCEFFGFSVFELRARKEAYNEIFEAFRSGTPDFVIFTSANGVKHAFNLCTSDETGEVSRTGGTGGAGGAGKAGRGDGAGRADRADTADRAGEEGETGETEGASKIDICRVISAAKIVAIGPATMRELRSHGVQEVLMPSDYSSRGLMRMFAEIDLRGKFVVLLRSSAGSEELREFLRERGANVRDIAVYEPVLLKTPENRRKLQSFIAFKPDFVVFTSSLTFKSLIDLANEFHMREEVEKTLNSSKIIAIGNPTAETIASYGFNCRISPKSTVEDVMKLIEHESVF